MGLYANAEMIWGIPVLAYMPNYGDPTPYWSEEDEDWCKLPGELEIRQYGHYEDPDNQRGILTSQRVEPFMADCWEPVRFDPDPITDQVLSKSDEQLQEWGQATTGLSFYRDAAWWLVASFG